MKESQEILVKKTILIALSTILISIGVTLFLQSSLGSDPVTIFVDGLRHRLDLQMGDAALLNNVVTLTLAVIFARKFIHLGTVIGALAIGPLMNFFAPWVQLIFSSQPGIFSRILMVAVGQLIICFGVALNLSVKFGFGTTDALLVRLCERYRLKYRSVKLLADLTYTLGGVLLGGVFGPGSVASVLTGGPIITYFMETFAKSLVASFRIPDPSLSV